MVTHPARPRIDRATIVFDGQCGFCRSGVAMLARLDGGRNFEFLSLHDTRCRQVLPDRSHGDLLKEMHLVEASGQWHAGAEAIRVIARRVPFLWGAAGYLHLPGTLPLWQKLYAAIARRRYRISQRLGCGSGTCTIHMRA